MSSIDPGLPQVRGCPGQLQLLLFELLQHSRSATQRLPEQGVVQVRTLARDGRAAVEVEHDGPPVRPDEEVRLFDPLADLDAGLGLARRVARQHGGELRLARDGEAAFLVLDLPGAHP
jgi:signal transduction histidine kinase